MIEVFEIEYEGCGHLLNFILSQIESVDADVRLPTKFIHTRNFVHVEVNLPQIRHKSKYIWNCRQIISIEIDVV